MSVDDTWVRMRTRNFTCVERYGPDGGIEIVSQARRKLETVRHIQPCDPMFFVCSRLIGKNYLYMDRLAFIAACHDLMPKGHPTINQIDDDQPWRWVPPDQARTTPLLKPIVSEGVTGRNPPMNFMLERYEQGVTAWIRHSKPLTTWLNQPIAFQAPADWPDFIWPFIMNFGITPFEVACCPIFDKLKRLNVPKSAILRAWCCGMSTNLIATLLDMTEAQIKTEMISAVRLWVEDRDFIIWAANPDFNFLPGVTRKKLHRANMWELVQRGVFPKSDNSRPLVTYPCIIDPLERHNVIAWSSRKPISFKELGWNQFFRRASCPRPSRSTGEGGEFSDVTEGQDF